MVCQLEASGKWPEELAAIADIKTAFYVHLAKGLANKRLSASPTTKYLDVLKVRSPTWLHFQTITTWQYGEIIANFGYGN